MHLLAGRLAFFISYGFNVKWIYLIVPFLRMLQPNPVRLRRDSMLGLTALIPLGGMLQPNPVRLRRTGFFTSSGHSGKPETCGYKKSRAKPGIGLAEKEGFEPSIPVKVYTLSRRASSTTPALLLLN